MLGRETHSVRIDVSGNQVKYLTVFHKISTEYRFGGFKLVAPPNRRIL